MSDDKEPVIEPAEDDELDAAGDGYGETPDEYEPKPEDFEEDSDE